MFHRSPSVLCLAAGGLLFAVAATVESLAEQNGRSGADSDWKREAILARVDSARPSDLGGLKVERIGTEGGYKYYLEDGSWVLIRFSGTEPLLRVYTETKSPEVVENFLRTVRVVFHKCRAGGFLQDHARVLLRFIICGVDIRERR